MKRKRPEQQTGRNLRSSILPKNDDRQDGDLTNDDDPSETTSNSTNDGKKGSLKAVRASSSKNGGAKKKDQVPAFLTKTFEIMGDKTIGDIAGWSKNGTCVIVRDADRFAAEILPAYFKHNNFTSFVRQLNMYGFHKTKQDANVREFHHPHFQEGKPEKLVLIRRNRKKESYKSVSQRQTEDKGRKSSRTKRNANSRFSASLTQANLRQHNDIQGQNQATKENMNYVVLRQDVNFLGEGHDHVCHTINDLWVRVKKLKANETLLTEHVLLLRNHLSASLTLQSNLLTAVQNLSTCFALNTDENSISGPLNLNDDGSRSGRVDNEENAASRQHRIVEEQRQLLVRNSFVIGEVGASIKHMYESLRSTDPLPLLHAISGNSLQKVHNQLNDDAEDDVKKEPTHDQPDTMASTSQSSFPPVTHQQSRGIAPSFFPTTSRSFPKDKDSPSHAEEAKRQGQPIQQPSYLPPPQHGRSMSWGSLSHRQPVQPGQYGNVLSGSMYVSAPGPGPSSNSFNDSRPGVPRTYMNSMMNGNVRNSTSYMRKRMMNSTEYGILNGLGSLASANAADWKKKKKKAERRDKNIQEHRKKDEVLMGTPSFAKNLPTSVPTKMH